MKNKRQLARLGKNEAADLSNFTGTAASASVGIVDFAGRGSTNRGFPITVKDLGKPKADSATVQPGASGWVPTYDPSSGAVKFALFGGKYFDAIEAHPGDPDVNGVGVMHFGLTAVGYLDVSPDRIVVWGIDSANDLVHVEITGKRLKNSFAYFLENPTSIKTLSLNMNDTAQAALGITQHVFSPFLPNLQSKEVRFADYDNPTYNKNNLLYIPIVFVTDKNSGMVYELPAGKQTTITMYAGDIINVGKGLAKRAVALSAASQGLIKLAR